MKLKIIAEKIERTHIFLDDIEIKGVTDYELDHEVGKPPKLKLTMYVELANVKSKED